MLNLSVISLSILQYYPILIYILVFALISYFISKALAKKNVKMLLVIPLVLLGFTLVFGVAAFLTNDWGALGYFLLAALGLGGFVSSSISSIILYYTKFKNPTKKD
ncbi:MAG: hypothetical protein JXL97_03560 [Bacteroidales bacterium]|nr:hypothetical protein [Bacteroidales bacterium]